jgi:hypothetical protein
MLAKFHQIHSHALTNYVTDFHICLTGVEEMPLLSSAALPVVPVGKPLLIYRSLQRVVVGYCCAEADLGSLLFCKSRCDSKMIRRDPVYQLVKSTRAINANYWIASNWTLSIR